MNPEVLILRLPLLVLSLVSFYAWKTLPIIKDGKGQSLLSDQDEDNANTLSILTLFFAIVALLMLILSFFFIGPNSWLGVERWSIVYTWWVVLIGIFIILGVWLIKEFDEFQIKIRLLNERGEPEKSM